MLFWFIGILLMVAAGGWNLFSRMHHEALPKQDRVALGVLWIPLFLAPLALLLADFERFSKLSLGLCCLGFLGLGIGWRVGARKVETGSGYTFKGTWWLVPILLLATWLVTPGFEYLHGGWDPGEYPNTANQIAREGSLLVQDTLLPTLSPLEQQGLMHNWDDLRTTLQPGSQLIDPDSGWLTPDYYHLYPAWLAIFSEFFGFKNVYWGHTFISLYGLVAVYFLGVALFGRASGTLALIFMVSSPAILFYSRCPASEMLSLFLLFTAFWAYVKHQTSSHPAFYITGAVASGAALMCHGLNLFCLAPLAAFLLFQAIYTPDRKRTRALIFFVVAVLAAFVRNFWHAPIMTKFLVWIFFRYPIYSIVLGALCGGGFIALTIFLKRKSFPHLPPMRASRLLALALSFLALYLYFVRPEKGGNHNTYNFILLSWQVSVPCLLLAILYFLLETWEKKIAGKLMFIIACALPFAILIANKSIQPLMMWCLRRYVPVLIPCTLILAAAAAWLLWKRQHKAGKLLSVLLVGVGLGFNLYHAYPQQQVTDFKGLPSNLERLAQKFTGAQFILFDHPYYSTPLARTFDLPAYQYTEVGYKYQGQRAQGAWSVLTRKAKQGEQAYWVSHKANTAFFGAGFHMLPVGEYSERYPIIKRPRIGMPRRTEDMVGNLWIYALSPTPDNYQHPVQEYTIDVGNSTIGMHEGWHRQMPRRERMVRWSFADSSIHVPAFPAQGTEYILSLNGGRKGGGPPVRVQVLLEGQEVAILKVEKGWKEYSFSVPANASGSISPRLTLISDTWNPEEFGIAGYPNGLGVMVDQIVIRPVDYATTESM